MNPVDADEAGGTLTTRPVRFNAKHLFVKVDDPKGELLEPRRKELAEIFENTRRIERYQELETLLEYPAGVAKFLKRVSRVRIERLLYRIL